jgi:hypothetical protein
MQSTWRTPHVRSRLALGACFLHAVPGAIGGIETSDGERFVVAHRSDALLTPCQLRAGLLEPPRPGVPHLSEIIRSVDVTGGVVDIGAGLYQRSHPAAPDERWFTTTLHPDRIMHIARDCPTDLDHAAVAVGHQGGRRAGCERRAAARRPHRRPPRRGRVLAARPVPRRRAHRPSGRRSLTPAATRRSDVAARPRLPITSPFTPRTHPHEAKPVPARHRAARRHRRMR